MKQGNQQPYSFFVNKFHSLLGVGAPIRRSLSGSQKRRSVLFKNTGFAVCVYRKGNRADELSFPAGKEMDALETCMKAEESGWEKGEHFPFGNFADYNNVESVILVVCMRAEFKSPSFIAKIHSGCKEYLFKMVGLSIQYNGHRRRL